MESELVLTTPKQLQDFIDHSIDEAFARNSKEETSTPDKLLTVNDLCDLFGKTKVTIHAWKRNGLIPYHRISGRIFFKKEEVMAALKSVNL